MKRTAFPTPELAEEFIKGINVDELPTKTLEELQEERSMLKAALCKLGDERAPADMKDVAGKINLLIKDLIAAKEKESHQTGAMPLAAE